ncbi:elongation of very long chain fatty acids protein 4-like [Panonychus citri]|uniref:elongation of very long chain fatty acids protein 4-like n=1 Tax=Panonychus citri TaxID=50023 RepID=UPI002307B639|nr:elongation of very long chain fatty acids protein 4-like [Panonychus citri]
MTFLEYSKFSDLILIPFQKVVSLYNWIHSYGDPRVNHWLLMSSPFPTLLIVTIYLLTVWYGPHFMVTRKPFKLRGFMIIYNFSIAWLNGWICYEVIMVNLNYNFICQLVDTSDDPYEKRIAGAIWWYYFSKCLEFTDTLLFIVRKKPAQLTFLHIYHHSTMFAFWWVGAKFVPGGSALTGAMVNCFVHVIMYSYYGLTACGPTIQKYLWWKKYLTILQLIQFTAGVVLGLHAIITNCQFTRWMQYFFVCYAFSFIILFSNFYNGAYVADSAVFKPLVSQPPAARSKMTPRTQQITTGKKTPTKLRKRI